MRVVTNLRGWADSLTGYNKIKFALQLAIYEVKGDCDWVFKIKVKDTTGFVYDPSMISIIATRCHSVHYEKGKPDTRCITEYKFSFMVKSYTLVNVYKEARVALKNTLPRLYDIEVMK